MTVSCKHFTCYQCCLGGAYILIGDGDAYGPFETERDAIDFCHGLLGREDAEFALEKNDYVVYQLQGV